MPINDDRPHLPPRLTALVPLLARGMTNIEMANALTLGVHSVESYVSELKSAVNARDRVELVLICRTWAK